MSIDTFMAVTRLFGAKVKRREDPRFLTGRGRYTHNLSLPGMVYACFVRSPHAHAKIVGVDVSAAEKSSGVLGVFTGAELADKLGPIPCAWQIPNSDIKVPRYMPLAVDKARFVGDPVAVVVATSYAEALDAASLVKVEYEKLPAVTNPEEAVKPGAPQLYDDVPNNTAFVWRASGGDVEKAFDGADVVVSQRLVNSRLQPTPMETRAVLADYNPTTDEATVYLTSQNPHVHRLLLSLVTGHPEHKLRVVSYDVGGGFGAKIHLYSPEVVLLHLAKTLKKPVKWMETRMENFTATIHGRDHIQYVDLAADRTGLVLGLRVKSYANMGAYLSTAAPGIPTILFGPVLSGPYRIPAISVEVVGALTNTAPVDAYRGAGRPEATYILERMIDILSRRLGKDPAEVRLKNFIKKEMFPYSAMPIGLVYDSGDYEKAFMKALELSRYSEWRKKQEEMRAKGKLIGIGISSYIEICGLGPSSVARATGFGLGLWESTIIRVHPTGKVSVYIGGHPHGQGEETTFAQIVADRLQIPIEDVEILHGDTAMIPFGMGTYGSRTTPVAGASVAIGCDRILEKARKIAAHLLEAGEKDIEYVAGKFYVREMPEKSKSFAEVAYAAYGAGANELPQGLEPGLETTVFFDPPNFTFPFGTHICITEVDPETGKVKVLEYYAVDDCGNRINPMIVEGQIHGGIAQGLAQALYEEASYDSDGQLLTSNLTEYLVPTAMEIPRIETAETVTPSPVNPLGVKGIGEAGTIASTPAVVNSVLDALAHLGLLHIDMPLKPEKIHTALRQSNPRSKTF
ncbi:carbon monoxide dehydrogenase large subunit [Candidatus Caldarchaeum subterraneum]|uniref:Aerobic-type carbon monoxide dehydrogenase, large subunit CoxL/CutL homologs n=2 Tax=Caldiarchaeum subterraneum TaxID=311458 RepID=Q4LEF0_CALS0|nr:aerobic-type carbon monoxide dehydrogenase, large subunit CoxL/CutL homologs [Candidatus Caldarchaeum subterraneum]BAJ47074.1 carbon monoxide dehydrogenase large subunit [Candidatus Caldarchaeum subterraneum]BAJ51596.1 carbon monoxide dehydrogenase large subunit [Candidatus Caldarchaeum subterraneum]